MPPRPLTLAAFALCLNYANADATTDYIANMQWPVSVVAPKMHFMAPNSTVAAPWCNYSLIEAIGHALFLDEPNITSSTNTTTTATPTGSSAAAMLFEEDFAQSYSTTPISALELWAKPFAFFSDVYDYIDPSRKVKVGSTSALPIYLDKNAKPEAKFRLLITTLALSGTQNKALDSIMNAHARLSHDPAKQKELVKALMNRETHDVTVSDFTKHLTADDDTKMNDIPETLVGFLSSRVLTELLSTIMTDAWGQSIIHDSKDLSITAGVCRATAIGRKSDFMFEVNGCTLIAILLNFLGCTYSTATIECGAEIDKPVKYELANCELLPSDQSNATVVNLSLLPSVEDAVNSTTHNFTEAGRTTEGPTFYLLQLAQHNWAAACGQRWCQKSPANETFITELLPGWPIVKEFWIAQENSSAEVNVTTKVSPFTAIAKKQNSTESDESCEFLIVNRGTMTNWEWFMNLNMAHTILSPAQNPLVRGHMGYYSLGKTILDGINQYLTEEFADGVCKPNRTTIWFHGHSLGGGQTNMQSLLLASYWANLNTPLKVNAVAFASLRIFNEEASKLQRSLVNTRNLMFNYDMVPHIGCPDTGIPRCDPTYWSAGMNGAGIDEPDVEHNGLISIEGFRDFRYAERFDTEETNITQTLTFFDDRRIAYIPVTAALLLEQNNIFLNIPTTLQLGVGHGCSYQCYVSRNFCSVEPAKQMACVRAPVNMDKPDNCLNQTISLENIYGSTDERVASLDCSFKYWGYDKLPGYTSEDSYSFYDTSLPYFCHNILPGMGPATLASLIKH